MPRTQTLAELFRAIAERDFDVAAGVAEEICNDEKQKGHHVAARALRGALASHNMRSNGIARPTGTLFLKGLVRTERAGSLSDVELEPRVRAQLDALLVEWKHRDALKTRGLRPRSKVILYGPPGCGKSLTASALGNELRMPVYVVRFDAVIGAYLGQTAIHLRQLFHFAETSPSVLVLDEIDALGKQRGNPLDVGELDRIVIALMQELEHSRPAGLVVATSNLPEHLDDALWRRFDLSLELKKPSPTTLARFARRVAKSKGVTLTASVLSQANAAKSFADAEAVVICEVRRQILAQLEK